MRKRTILVSAIPLALAGIVGASAFISTSDTGTANATVTSATATPSIHTTVSIPATPLDFDDFTTFTVSVQNTGTNAYKPTQVTVPATVAGADIHPAVANACPFGSFTIDNKVDTLPSTALAPGSAAIPVATAHLNFVNLPAVDQKGCLGATVTIRATVS
jgi:hypothetical protein